MGRASAAGEKGGESWGRAGRPEGRRKMFILFGATAPNLIQPAGAAGATGDIAGVGVEQRGTAQFRIQIQIVHLGRCVAPC